MAPFQTLARTVALVLAAHRAQVAVTVRRKVSPFHRFARPMRAGEAQSLFDELTANSCERNFKSCVNELAVRLAALEVVLGRLEH